MLAVTVDSSLGTFFKLRLGLQSLTEMRTTLLPGALVCLLVVASFGAQRHPHRFPVQVSVPGRGLYPLQSATFECEFQNTPEAQADRLFVFAHVHGLVHSTILPGIEAECANARQREQDYKLRELMFRDFKGLDFLQYAAMVCAAEGLTDRPECLAEIFDRFPVQLLSTGVAAAHPFLAGRLEAAVHWMDGTISAYLQALHTTSEPYTLLQHWLAAPSPPWTTGTWVSCKISGHAGGERRRSASI